MRGQQEPQVTMLAFGDLEERVPADHPLRAIKALDVLDFIQFGGAGGTVMRTLRWEVSL